MEAAAEAKLQVHAVAVDLDEARESSRANAVRRSHQGKAAHHQRGRTHRFSRVAVRLSFSTPGILPSSRREKVSEGVNTELRTS